MDSCSGYGDSGGAWQPQGPGSLSLSNRCPVGGSFQINAVGQALYGVNGQWNTVTPPSIGITGALTPYNEVLVAPGMNTTTEGYGASYFWNGGIQTIADENTCCGGMDYGLGVNRNDLGGSHYFGFQVSCINTGGCGTPANGGGQLLDVRGIQLTAVDNTPPAVQAAGSANAWYESSRWIRGTWPASWQATDDSGICGMRMVINGQSIQGPTAAANHGSWTQCPNPQTMTYNLDTTRYANGPMSFVLSAADAVSPALVSSPSETLRVDNAPVTVAVSGPADAPATAGTQYVSASAAAGPSGVAGILCSADGSPYTSYSGASAQVPVSGIGPHAVSCYAQNNAYDNSLTRATSPIQTLHLSIRQPTVSVITFGSRVLDALRCHPARVVVHLRARWVTVHRHGKPIRVHRRSRTVVRHVVRCHPRVVIRKVRVGRRVHRRRVVLLPHTVQIILKHVRYRHTTVASGWVGQSDGTALGGAPVQVVGAADNGRGHWRTAATATTNAAGFWKARLPAGPSRLLAAVYPGSATTEPATSADIRTIVHARVGLRIRPRLALWGHTVKITGRVLGGYIPGGKLLRLRIGAVGVGFSGTAGIPDINHRGYFHTRWTFGAGNGTVRYWFSVSTLAEPDYPYAPSSSRRVYVTVHG